MSSVTVPAAAVRDRGSLRRTATFCHTSPCLPVDTLGGLILAESREGQDRPAFRRSISSDVNSSSSSSSYVGAFSIDAQHPSISEDSPVQNNTQTVLGPVIDQQLSDLVVCGTNYIQDHLCKSRPRECHAAGFNSNDAHTFATAITPPAVMPMKPPPRSLLDEDLAMMYIIPPVMAPGGASSYESFYSSNKLLAERSIPGRS